YLAALALLSVAMAVAFWLRRSRFGARLVALRENEDAAAALGIDLVRTKTQALALSGAITATGGVLYAQTFLYVDPSIAFGIERSVEMLLVVMIGGAGTVWGPVLGAVVFTGIEELTRVAFGGTGRGTDLVVHGALLVLIAVYQPSGVMGLFTRRTPPAVPPPEPEAEFP
ncbi:MAG: branched-chain amino acid ABC transporter permease, partial [Deltaproteobacteria bacterium]